MENTKDSKAFISSFDKSPATLSQGILFWCSDKGKDFVAGGKIHFISSRFWRVSLNSTDMASGANRRLTCRWNRPKFGILICFGNTIVRVTLREATNGSDTKNSSLKSSVNCRTVEVSPCKFVILKNWQPKSSSRNIPDIELRSMNKLHDIENIQDFLSDLAACFALSLANNSCSSSVLRWRWRVSLSIRACSSVEI